MNDPDPILTAGMHLRDYFAAKAMQGYIIASHGAMGKDWPCDGEFTEWAYDIAEAMLKERESR